ncbi:MAG: TRAP transporter small permease [Halomonas sp.]|uniref:TRAP transporter small permease n=1 Tax=Halomonas sp. TaxID=1486246 RepID=UPI003F8EB3B3
MRRINDLIERVFLKVAGTLFAIFIVTILYQVVARNYLKISVAWSDEVAMACFIWSVFLGAAVALRRRQHYVIEVLPKHFVITNRALRLLGGLACLPLIYVLVVHGQILTDMGWNRRSVSLGTPMAYVFMVIPISGVAMLLFSLEILHEDLRALCAGHQSSPAAVEEHTQP